ncbi:ABC-type transport auxiliary lipoprotein family protein [Hydrogenophaga sp. PAMC20947]|uniref:ABC-type transport auxiliary lipoprotein family protein n=1 Tax=Hydrogenophaga sp. PAMC20947 TaxID=2565558 RepID=UPI00109DBE18|nr:ABC-type transport auxiliary lipoprotein family protein [Hydrogenophaga sp. PAMC20947]QCB45284.1 hypothetical protein E5678_04125 [Hydrogenophaga sp. PAMC20947]
MHTPLLVSPAVRSSHGALRATGQVIAALSLTVLAACSTPQAPATKTVYDFGLTPSVVGTPPPRATPAAALLLADVQAPMALNATAVQYRLSYDNDQELRPYALARWSMAPAQLVQQRLKLALNARGPVLAEGQGSPSHSLKIELEEFVQVFEQPQSSLGRVSLRATLLNGSQLVDQIRVRSTAVAPTNDAAGGVRALTQATDAAAQQLVTWLDQQKP